MSAEPDTARIEISIQTPDSAQSLVEKLYSALEIKTRHATYNLYPAIGYDPSSGVELGMMPIITVPVKKSGFVAKYYRPSTIFTRLSYSTKQWLSFAADFKVFTYKGYVIDHLFEVQNIPESYFSPQADGDSATRYQSFRYGMRGKAFKELWNTVQLGIKYDYSYASVTDVSDSRLNKSVTGYDGGAVLGLGPAVRYDTRDDADYPLKGSDLSIAFQYYPSISQYAYTFTQTSIDLRQYFNPFSDLVVALQLAGEFTDGSIPFYLKPRIAGKDRLRGFAHRSKFVDNHAMLCQAELRKHLFWKFGAVVFAGAGNTLPTINTDPTRDLKYVYGFGGRFSASSDSKINFRLDMGIGSNGDTGVFMTAREAF